MFDLLSWDKDKKVNSGYGYRSKASTGGVGSTNHKGIDLSSYNDNIPAVVSGKVVANAYNKGRGYYITILGNDGYSSTYQHLATASPLSVGSMVKEGDTIGTQGATGASKGKHLHYEVKSPSGFYVNPIDYLAGKLSNGNAVTDGVTDGYDRPINGGEGVGATTDFDAMSIVGKLITFIAIIGVVIMAMVMFTKAFDIKIF